MKSLGVTIQILEVRAGAHTLTDCSHVSDAGSLGDMVSEKAATPSQVGRGHPGFLEVGGLPGGGRAVQNGVDRVGVS